MKRLSLFIVLLLPLCAFAQSLKKDSVIIKNSTQSEKEVVLKDVQVTANQLVKTQNKLVLYPTKIQRKHSSDGYTLLYNLMLPQLKVDPFDKTVKSIVGDVLLCINGRKVSKEEVQVLLSKDILRVDYYEKNHPEHPEVKEVIDFITVKKDDGAMISVRGTQHLNNSVGEYATNAHYYRKNSEFSFALQNSCQNYSNSYKQSSESFLFPNQAVVRTQIGEPASQKQHSWAGFGNYFYRNDRTKVNLTFGYSDNKEPNNDLKATSQYSNDTPKTSVVVNESSESTNRGLYWDSYFYRKLTSSQVLSAYLSANYNINGYSRLYQETRKDKNEIQRITSDVNEKLLRLSGQVSYVKTFGDKSTLSVSLFHNLTITHDKYRNDINADEHLTASESMFFLTYSKSWKRLSVDASWGQSFTHFSQRDIISKNYSAIQPSLTIEYELNKRSSIKLMQNVYTNSPSLEWQSALQQRVDFMQVKRGNPNVKQMNVLDSYLYYNLYLSKFSLIAYIWNMNNFKNTSYDVFLENNTFVHTYVSDGQYHTLRPSVCLKYDLIKNMLTAKLTGEWNKYWITGVNNRTLSQWAVNSELLFMHNNWMASLGYDSPQKRLVNSGRVRSTDAAYNFKVGYTYKNLNLSFCSRNPFSKSNLTTDFVTKDYANNEVKILNRMGDHIYYVNFSYNLNFGKKHNYKESDLNMEGSSAILKGKL